MKKIIFLIFFFSKVNAVTVYDHEIENFISDILLITHPTITVTLQYYNKFTDQYSSILNQYYSKI